MRNPLTRSSSSRPSAASPVTWVFSLLVFAVSACAPGGDDPETAGSPDSHEPRKGGTLVIGRPADIDSWNPYTSNESTAAGVLELLYPRLFLEIGQRDGSSRFEPWLAESWEFSTDRLELTFHLRPDARWSSGQPVTCDDVRFTYDAQHSEQLAWWGTFIKERITDLRCPDDHTAVFVFSEAYNDQLLDANDDAIVPAAYGDVPFAEWASTPWEDRAITCGPFRLASVSPGQEAVLERDEGWWGAAETRLDRVVLRTYPEADRILPGFLAGEVDVMLQLPALRADEVTSDPGLNLVELPSLAYTYLGWNALAPEAYAEDRRRRGCDDGCDEGADEIRNLQRTRPHPVLADPRVRRALALAIDRQDIVDGLWNAHARVGTTPIVSASWAHSDGGALPFDQAAASELLDEAGWTDRDGDGVRERNGTPLEVRVIVNADNTVRRQALERVQASLARVGVRIVPEPLPRQEFVQRARDKQFDAILSGWWAGTRIEPQNLLSTDAAARRGNNFNAWSSARSDELMERATAAATRDEALPLWGEWQALCRDEQPVTVLYEETRLLGHSARLHAPDPSYLNPLQNLHEWWVSAGR